MKTKMRNTSLQAFRTAKPRKAEVLEVITRLGPISNLQISGELDLPINVITPATNMLVKENVVREAFRAPSPITGRRSIFWEAV